MIDATEFAARLAAVRARIEAACDRCDRDPNEVSVLAVSKAHPAAALETALAAGQHLLGENRVAELAAKAAALVGRGVRWHMIGSVQTNKVKALWEIPDLRLLHSLDRVDLADELQRRAAGGRTLPCLLQVAVTRENTKHGVRPADAPDLLEHVRAQCPALDVQGLMGMGPRLGDPSAAFSEVANLAAELRDRSGLPLAVISMGMSGDLDAAVEAGSTLVRVGTALFGDRPGKSG